MMTRQPQNQHDYSSKLLNELSALVLNIIRSPPPPIDYPDQNPPILRRRRTGPSFQQITPAGFASLLLGISLSLMLCGSVTFFIGFILMPWVFGLVVFLYFMGVVSSISMIGRAILCCNSAPPSPRKDASACKNQTLTSVQFCDWLDFVTFSPNCWFGIVQYIIACLFKTWWIESRLLVRIAVFVLKIECGLQISKMCGDNSFYLWYVWRWSPNFLNRNLNLPLCMMLRFNYSKSNILQLALLLGFNWSLLLKVELNDDFSFFRNGNVCLFSTRCDRLSFVI